MPAFNKINILYLMIHANKEKIFIFIINTERSPTYQKEYRTVKQIFFPSMYRYIEMNSFNLF